MALGWDKVSLGRTGLRVSRIGLATGGGRLPAAEVERAFERGINYLYWGTLRGSEFGKAIANIAKRDREKMVLVVQSYSRSAILMRPSLERALRKLKTDYTDLLLLGWWNEPPPKRILDAALELKERGRVRHIMISCHQRTTFERYIADPSYGAIMVRYNGSHPGAESEVFPHVRITEPPGVVAYTVTRWGALFDPKLTPNGEQVPRVSDCYRFALTPPEIDMCLSAPETGQQLDETLATLDRDEMDADELAWMKRVGRAVKEATASRSVTSPIHILDRIAGHFSQYGNSSE